jgi:Mce-associated membrane protein
MRRSSRIDPRDIAQLDTGQNPQADPLDSAALDFPADDDGDADARLADADGIVPDSEPGGDDDEPESGAAQAWWPRELRRIVALVALLVLVVAGGALAGYYKWQTMSAGGVQQACTDSVQAARDATVAMLSYRAGTVEKDLATAMDKLTGQFRDSYSSLTTDVVIPGARQRQITAVASVSAAASVAATPKHAVVLVFVNQTVTVGTGAPTATASAVRVTLDDVQNRWLISGFDPV